MYGDWHSADTAERVLREARLGANYKRLADPAFHAELRAAGRAEFRRRSVTIVASRQPNLNLAETLDLYQCGFLDPKEFTDYMRRNHDVHVKKTLPTPTVEVEAAAAAAAAAAASPSSSRSSRASSSSSGSKSTAKSSRHEDSEASVPTKRRS